MPTFTVETVTPLFLGGANPRGAPEVRAASFRGALRFWLRALLGGVLGDDPSTVLAHESRVFGSTEHASPVVVRVQPGSLATQLFSRLVAGQPGIGYLFFAARGTRAEPERSAFTAGSTMTVTLSLRLGVEGLEALQGALAAFWLLTRLGGLGARARRGAGSLQVREAAGVPEDLPSFVSSASTPQALQRELHAGLGRLRRLVGGPQPVRTPSVFAVLHPAVCRIWVVDRVFPSWLEALEAVGVFLSTFRRQRSGIEFPAVRAASGGRSTLPPMERAILGLPIVFFDPSVRRPLGILEGQEHDRRASPLLIRVTRLGSQYGLVLTLFRAQFLPPGEQLVLRDSSGGREVLARGPVPDWTWLEEALLPALAKEVGALLEVTGW